MMGDRLLRCVAVAVLLIARPAVFAQTVPQSSDDELAKSIVEKADHVRFPVEPFEVAVTISTSGASAPEDVRRYRVLAKGHENTIVMVTEPASDRGQVLLELYERLVEAATVAPTFYADFPTEVSPLTRAHRKDPRLAERWDLVAFGTELGTGYSELVDPVEERARLTAQSLLAAGGDPEAMVVDEEFLQALEYGMPPTGGMGMGIDRVLIMFTGETIRETILFPMVRPE